MKENTNSLTLFLYCLVESMICMMVALLTASFATAYYEQMTIASTVFILLTCVVIAVISFAAHKTGFRFATALEEDEFDEEDEEEDDEP